MSGRLIKAPKLFGDCDMCGRNEREFDRKYVEFGTNDIYGGDICEERVMGMDKDEVTWIN